MTLTAPPPVQWARSSFTIDNLNSGWMAHQQGMNSGLAWTVANRALYIPLRVPRRVIVRKLGVGSASSVGAGNCDIGVYSATGERLVSSGSFAKVNVSTIIVADVTDTTIGPGLYYVGINNDTTTDTIFGSALSAPAPAGFGVLTEQLGSLALPSQATFAIDNTLTFIPLVTMLLVTEIS